MTVPAGGAGVLERLARAQERRDEAIEAAGGRGEVSPVELALAEYMGEQGRAMAAIAEELAGLRSALAENRESREALGGRLEACESRIEEVAGSWSRDVRNSADWIADTLRDEARPAIIDAVRPPVEDLAEGMGDAWARAERELAESADSFSATFERERRRQSYAAWAAMLFSLVTAACALMMLATVRGWL